jgi:hypothetical protein
MNSAQGITLGFTYSAVTGLKTMPDPAPQQPHLYKIAHYLGNLCVMPQQWASRAHRPLVTNQRSSSDTKPFTASRNWLYKFVQGCNLRNVKPYDKKGSADMDDANNSNQIYLEP